MRETAPKVVIIGHYSSDEVIENGNGFFMVM